MDPVTYVKEFQPDLFEKHDKPPYDAVENPPHYAQYAIQPIVFIMANKLGYCEGNVVKYISRWRMKDGIQDLKKARNYIDILIEEAEKEELQRICKAIQEGE